MLNFSLKTLLALVAFAGIASCLMARPTIFAAIVVALLAVLSLVTLTIIGLWIRRPFPIVVACACVCYLGIADGGWFPELERYLPTEWLLCQCSTSHTVIDSGRKRSVSLSKWAARVCLEENHKDRNLNASSEHFPSHPTIVASDDSSNISTTVKLPKFAMTTVNTIRTVTKRDDPENRAFFIIGHCLFVILSAVFVILLQSRRDADNLEINADSHVLKRS